MEQDDDGEAEEAEEEEQEDGEAEEEAEVEEEEEEKEEEEGEVNRVNVTHQREAAARTSSQRVAASAKRRRLDPTAAVPSSVIRAPDALKRAAASATGPSCCTETRFPPTAPPVNNSRRGRSAILRGATGKGCPDGGADDGSGGGDGRSGLRLEMAICDSERDGEPRTFHVIPEK